MKLNIQKTMKLKSLLGLALVATLLAGTASIASAQIIYRETFGNATASTADYTTVGWTNDVFNTGSGLFTGLTSTNNSRGISNLAGRPANLDNINAGTSTSLTNGFNFVGSFTGNSGINARWVSYTTEYPFSLAASDITEISFYAGHTGATLANVTSRPALQVGSTWYVTTTSATTVSIGGAAFAADAEFESFSFTGTTQLSALNAADLTITNTTVSLSSLGNVSAFGVFATTPVNFDFVRFDTFTVTAVPEPSTVGLMGLALAGLVLRRRRKIA